MAIRTYLAVLDESDEARVALRFAAARATKTGGTVHILTIVPKQDFVAWGGVQATIEEEQQARAEALVQSAAGTLFGESGQRPAISVETGDAAQVIHAFLKDHPDIATLVLGAASDGAPGPLVAHFSGADAGRLPCPVMIVPGGLTNEEVDRLS